jgi:hypothetical protein
MAEQISPILRSLGNAGISVTLKDDFSILKVILGS